MRAKNAIEMNVVVFVRYSLAAIIGGRTLKSTSGVVRDVNHFLNCRIFTSIFFLHLQQNLDRETVKQICFFKIYSNCNPVCCFFFYTLLSVCCFFFIPPPYIVSERWKINANVLLISGNRIDMGEHRIYI